MIASLSGTVVGKDVQEAILEVNGIGYMIHVPLAVAENLRVGNEARLWTHQVIREDAHELFGFTDLDSRLLFKKLISVSGVGPRTALQVMNIGSVADIRTAIDSSDVARLTSVPGIGAKTAQKIVLDLKGKLPIDAGMTMDQDASEALIGLGYSRALVAKALASIAPDITSSTERVRAALRMLGKH